MIPHKILYFETLGSTNTQARELIEKQAIPGGAIIWTTHQNSGRGQGSKRWESEPGQNICVSIVLEKPPFKPNQQFEINRRLTLGLLRYFRRHISNARIHIKWPNDIYIDDRKICGILIEHRLLGACIEHTIMGFGININQTSFSPDIPNPVSLSLLLNKKSDLQDELNAVLTAIDWAFGRKNSGRDAYHKKLYLLQKDTEFESDGERFKGRIIGTDTYGRLRILCQDGERVFAQSTLRYILGSQS